MAMGLPRASLVLLLNSVVAAVSVLALGDLEYQFSSFDDTNRQKFALLKSNINTGALQVTPDTADTREEFSIANKYGRVFLDKRFKLRKGKSLVSFNTTFVINIVPRNGTGEGLAFIITNAKSIPENSHGQYLGLVNSTTDGSPKNNLVAVEFDTRRNANDPDDNHVGLDINSIDSVAIFSLRDRGINLSSASDIAASIRYDGGRKRIDVFVAKGNAAVPSVAVISVPLDLSRYLEEDEMYVGFSASTGNQTELNCIRSWNLTVRDIDPGEGKGELIGLAAGLPLGLITVIIIAGLGILWRRGHAHRRYVRAMERTLTDSTAGPRKFRLGDLRAATRNFHGQNVLGQGGFGAVYRGLLGNKTPIAVKRVSQNSRQGEKEFVAEVLTISRLRHKNLVRLLGWCHENEELLLVYDLMPNGSLDQLIFAKDAERGALDWERRYKIVCGVASALLYLHEECEQQVIHRDLKASNVMLDSEFNARLGDFGLARVIEHDKNSYTTTAIAGTPGYIAPECFHTGRATAESDVFSFGAVALEVACGRRPREESEPSLVDRVWGLYRAGKLLDAADPRLLGKFDEEEMKCMLVLGLACSHPTPGERPTIRVVHQILTKDAPPPLVPLFRPAFVWPPPLCMTEIVSSSSDFSTQ